MPHASAYTWGEAEDAMLRTLWREGHSKKQIGIRMGRSRFFIADKVVELKLAPPVFPANGVWNPENIAQVAKWWNEGCSKGEISRRLDISVHAISHKIAALNLPEQEIPADGWTKEKVAKLRELWPAGATMKEIKAATGKGKSAIIAKVRRLGIPKRPNPVIKWSVESEDLLTKLWHEGYSTEEIGRRVGFSGPAVIGKAARIGLPKRPQQNVKGNTWKPLGKRTSPKPQKPQPLQGGDFSPSPARKVVPSTVALRPVGRCQAVSSEGPVIRFCGEPIASGVYCERCHALRSGQERAA